MSITPQTKNWLRQSAALDGAVVSQTLLNLMERVEALEAAQPHDILLIGGPAIKAATVATDNKLTQAWNDHQPAGIALRVVYSLGRQYGAAQLPAAPPAPPVAPAGVLVERVGGAMERDYVIADIEGTWDAQARAAIREQALWLDQQGQHGCSLLLREEADR
jgi:hypothetical protein